METKLEKTISESQVALTRFGFSLARRLRGSECFHCRIVNEIKFVSNVVSILFNSRYIISICFCKTEIRKLKQRVIFVRLRTRSFRARRARWNTPRPWSKVDRKSSSSNLRQVCTCFESSLVFCCAILSHLFIIFITSHATFKAPRCHSWVETAEKAVVATAPVCKNLVKRRNLKSGYGLLYSPWVGQPLSFVDELRNLLVCTECKCQSLDQTFMFLVGQT